MRTLFVRIFRLATGAKCDSEPKLHVTVITQLDLPRASSRRGYNMHAIVHRWKHHTHS
jgi:hypothetical protein